MMNILEFPMDVFRVVIEHLIIDIGIRKARLLRSVNRAFDISILHAICVSQVVSIDDPATPTVHYHMSRRLRGRIFEVQSRHANSSSESYIQIVARVNHALDNMINDGDIDSTKVRHHAIAAAVNCIGYEPIDAQIEKQCILCGAAVVGNVSVIESLLNLQDPPDVNGKALFFDAPLFLAAARGHLDAVKCLLGYGARLMADTVRPAIPKQLPDQTHWNDPGVDIIRRSKVFRGRILTALQAAIRGGHDNVFHLLLLPSNRLPTTHLEYIRAIIAAAESGRLDFIQELFSIIGKDLSDFQDLDLEMMKRAIKHDQLEIVKWLVSKRYDVHAPAIPFRFNALEKAAGQGNIAMIAYFLDQGVHVYSSRIHTERNGPVIKAASLGHEEATHLLISHGADKTIALYHAASRGQSHLVRSLLRRFPDLPSLEGGKVGRDALSRALRAMNITSIALLVEAGVSLNDGWEKGSLPIHRVIEAGNEWMVRHLVSLGACPDTVPQQDPGGIKINDEIEINCVKVSERTWDWLGSY